MRHRIPFLTAVVLFACPGLALAHLSIIRQGPESFGWIEDNDRYGSSLVAGDFNADGHDDLAVGSPLESAGALQATGIVTISYGSNQGLTHVGAFQYGGGDFGLQEEGSFFGFSLAAADLNDDNFDDLIVSAPGADANGADRAGRIFIFAGSQTGLVPWVTYVQEDLGGFSVENDFFGIALATGNFNNDVHEDIAIGSPSWDGGTGVAFVLYGTEAGPFGDTDILTSETLGATLNVGDHFGLSLATGNVIGDTREDLVIGAPHRDAFDHASAGVVFLAPGGETGIDVSSATRFTAKVADDVSTHADFGYSLATLDVGIFDRIVVGEPDRTIGSYSETGRVVVVNTDASGPIDGSAIVLSQDMFGSTNEDNAHFGFRVATGYFADDGYMDIAVGTPNKDLGATDAGMTHVILGGPSDIGNSGYFVYGQDSIGDVREDNDQNGFAVTFGAFDATDQGTLVIGVPGEDNSSGQVHIVAPWRQFYYHSYKTAMVTDCQSQIIYSRKPFDRVFIASTTKVLTVLIACERAQLPASDPRHVSFDDTYTVPDWVANDIGGSSADLEQGEVVTLEDLVHMALLISGNDAAHAIGDMLHGANGPWDSIPLFLAEMNDRAIELGMFDSHFNNANGFEQEVVGPDFGDHYSTAYDMEILSRAAMANPLFREISETLSYSAIRMKPEGLVFHNFDSFQTWILENDWSMTGSGIKGGWTPAAQTTWCTSVEGGVGRAIATTFGTPDWGTDRRDALELLTLGLGDCATWQLWEDWEYEYINAIDGIVAEADDRDLFSMWPGVPRNMQINLFHATAEVEETDAFTQIHRETQISISPEETIDFGIAPYDGAAIIQITNMEARTVKILVEVPEDDSFHHIPAGGTIDLYIPPLGELSTFPWTITSYDSTGDPAYLAVKERYLYGMDAPAIPTTDPIFSVELYRNEQTRNDLIGVDIRWFQDGGEYVMMVHDPEVVVSVDEGTETTAVGGILQLAPPAPNPFSTSTRIGFTLGQAAEVAVSIHDAAGRRVRHYPSTSRSAGIWSTSWDGRLDDGAPAAPGVYFYRVVVNGSEVGGGKLVRLQ